MFRLLKRKAILTSFAAAGLSFVSMSAMASMMYISPDPYPPTVASQVIPTNIGHPKLTPEQAAAKNVYSTWKMRTPDVTTVGYGTPEKKSSYGTSLPIEDAIQLIVPNAGWQIHAQPGISGSVLVSWDAKHQAWTTTLAHVAKQAGLISTVDWNTKTVFLRVQPPEGLTLHRKPNSWSGISSYPSNFHVGPAVIIGAASDSHSEKKVDTTATQPSLSGLQSVFVLNGGHFILSSIQQWAKISGWKVHWNYPEDWRVISTTSFSGNFQTSVQQVVHALNANHIGVNVKFDAKRKIATIN